MEKIKVIEVEYNGHKFRSRTEARWAVYFDSLPHPIKWIYEPEGYDLDGTWYLPDFWLPDLGVFAEVKGIEFTKEERRKCEMLPHDCFLLAGSPDSILYERAGCPGNGDPVVSRSDMDSNGGKGIWSEPGSPGDEYSKDCINDAVKAAMTYSFW